MKPNQYGGYQDELDVEEDGEREYEEDLEAYYAEVEASQFEGNTSDLWDMAD